MKFIRRAKMIVIIGLAVLAVYQASWLWIVNITSRNLGSLSDLFATERELDSSGNLSELSKPYRLITGTGNGKFNVHYSRLGDSPNKAYGDSVITAMLTDGKIITERTPDYAELLSRPMLMFEYAFQMPSETFAKSYGQQETLLTQNGVDSFTRVLIQPQSVEFENIYVFFINGDNAVQYSLNPSVLEDAEMDSGISPPDDDGLYYIFADNTFAAVWLNAEFPLVEVANPYISMYGDRLMSHIRSCVELLFDNPSTVRESSSSDGEYIFSNDRSVVHYHKRDVLEYANYTFAGRPETEFTQDYMAALSFINRDSYVVNEFYLAEYETESGQTTFRFDYVINDFPMVLIEGWPDATDSGHAIEAVVDRGVVVRYKKLAHNFHIEDSGPLSDVFEFDITAKNPPLLCYRIGNSQNMALEYLYKGGDGSALGTG
jgi:hypothetical protein